MRTAPVIAVGLLSACTRPDPPNLVLLLVDDLDSPTMDQLPDLQASLGGQGMSFRQSFVGVSLCAPSRTSILRGQTSHATGILGNEAPFGGYGSFHDQALEESTIAVWLHEAGYRTALLGKYVNGYPGDLSPPPIPPGWDEWDVHADGSLYGQYDYTLDEDGDLVAYGSAPESYMTDVLAARARDLVDRPGNQPLFLMIAPSSPHQPATPPERYTTAFEDAKAPRDPAWDEADTSDKPAWVQGMEPLDEHAIGDIDELYRDRLRSMLGVRDLLDGLLEAFEERGELDRTYVFFTSDNGFHLGAHRLHPGKNSAFDSDLRVPLYVRGPDVDPGSASDRMVTNLDLAPTLAALGGARTPSWVEGRSLVPLLLGREPEEGWRSAMLLEHVVTPAYLEAAAALEAGQEPDDLTSTDSVPAFLGVRTERHTFVEYEDGEQELYDDLADPWQLENVAGSADPELLTALHEATFDLALCRGAGCRAVDRIELDLPPLGEVAADAPLDSSP